MPRKIVTLRDKYKSTTRYYPKITMDSLSPDVKAYIEGQGGGTEIDDNTTSLESTWSSKKISDSLDINLLFATTRNTIFYTKTTPTLNGDYYEITRADLLNPQSVDQRNYIAKQLILLDSDDKVKEIYSIQQFEEISPYTLKLTFRGSFGGGGKTLYQHNIYFDNAYTRLSGTSYPTRGTITIINDSNTPMTFESIKQFLAQNDFKCAYADLGTNRKWYSNVNIETKVSSSYKQNYGMCTDSDITYWCVVQTWGSTGTIYKTTTLDSVTYTINITDTVVAI